MVTGASGFVGRHMERYLGDHGWEVNICDSLFSFGVYKMIREHRISGTKPYDLVIHAAAEEPNRIGIDTMHDTFIANSLLDAQIFDWVVQTGQKRLVYLSSSAVYPLKFQTGNPEMRLHESLIDLGNIESPHDSYGLTKLHGEQLAQAARRYGAKVTVVRPFSGYGTDQSTKFPFGKFMQRAMDREDPFHIWGSAYQVRDFVHIDDICAAIMSAVETDTLEPVNICTGEGTSMHQLAMLITGVFGYKPEFHVVEDAPYGVHYRVGDPTLLHQIYLPRVSLAEGVARAYEGII
jgi:nucleoside-diphosphate-sugar epimerase